MTDFPPQNSNPIKPKIAVDYELMDHLVDANPGMSDEQILRLYQLHNNTPQVTVALLSDDLNDATKVILASALPDQHDPTNTHSQAQYRIDHKIDSGGQSHVYLAHRNDGTYQKTVVIKVLNQSIEGVTQKQQLMAEMQILADLKHPNIVSILDAGIDDQQRPWLMLDFIQGEHIDQFLRHHKLNQNQLSSLFIRLAKALKYIHQNNVVHADIKPANILVEMLDDQPHPVIIDFGIATTNGLEHPDSPYNFATPAFASPEQLDAQTNQVDHRSDIYSLGQLMKYLMKIQSQFHPATIWLNQDFAAILEHCMATASDDRYQDMQPLIDDLESHQHGDVVSVFQPATSQLISRTVKKYKWQFALLLITTTITGLLINHSIQQTNQNQALIQGAQSSHYYWQNADQIKNQTRLIYALPKRNIEPDFRSLEQKFDALLSQLALEPIATQKLSFAPLADAGISLGRFESAHELLLKAYATNQDDAEVKFKLAKNYLLLYQNELQSLQNYSVPVQRQVQRQRLQHKYFEPALKIFNSAENPVQDDQLISSLLDYFKGNYKQALQQLEAADNQLLWPIERLLLAAQIIREQAGQLLLSSQSDEALQMLNEAFDLLTQAKQIARSHPEVYKQMCQTESMIKQLQNHQNLSTISSCVEFLEILPETADAKLVAADAYAQLAKSWLDSGQSPDPLLQLSRTALEHDWSAESAYNYARAEQIKGHLLSTEGMWHLSSNQEFTAYFKLAIKHHQQAVNSQPNSYTAQLDLATSWYNLANHLRDNNDQTDHYFTQATKLLSELTQHADSTQFLPGFLVRVYTDHAYIRYQNGWSADQQLSQASQLVQQFKTESPEGHYAQLAAANLYWTYCDYLVLQGFNPQPYLAQAIEAFDQVIATEPSRWTIRYNQISAMLSGTTYYLAQNTVQTNQLDAIKVKLTGLESWVSSAINLDSLWGYYHNMMAINDLILNKNPQNSLQDSWQHNTACFTSPIDGYQCIDQMATALVTETKWNVSHPEALINLHKTHLNSIQKSIAAHPNHHQLLASYGVFLWLKTQNNTIEQTSKLEALMQAQVHLKMAISGNPLLATRYVSEMSGIESAVQTLTQVSN